MKKEYKYYLDVFIPQFIQCNKPMAVIEFNETSSKIKIATKDMMAKNYTPQTINPETVNEEIKNEKTVLVIILFKENNIKDALFKAKNILEEKLAILSFLCGYPCKIMNPGFLLNFLQVIKNFNAYQNPQKSLPFFHLIK